MANLIHRCNRILHRFGLNLGTFNTKHIKVVTLKPKVPSKGNVLLAYIVDPFLLKTGENVSQQHTNHFESLQIAHIFLDLGYSVDVIGYENTVFRPSKQYQFFISARTNLALIASRLNADCIKIAHFDTSHFAFNNAASYQRVLELQARRGVTSTSIRVVENNLALEHADYAVILGNEFTLGTYAYGNKPMFALNVPTPNVYPSPEAKDFDSCRKNYLWIGSSGFVHKGLDLVLEAFSQLPDFQLTVCGPLEKFGKTNQFCKQFHKELYETPNIKTVDWVDVSSPLFQDIVNNCLALIYPSSAEGQNGSAITCMQAGLIPIVSYQSGVDVHDYGVMLADCSVSTIKSTIQRTSDLATDKLAEMASTAWRYARTHHSHDAYRKRYREIVQTILDGQEPG